jgi:hypothetical protein
MPSPPAVHGGVGIPMGAGSHAGVSQSTPANLGLADETAQWIQLSSNIHSYSPPVPQHQAPEHAASSLTRHFGEVDALRALNMQVDPLAQHALENNGQFTQGEYAPFPGSSLAASSGQYHAARPEYMTPGPSSHTQRGSLAPLYPEDSFPLSPSSGLRDGFVSSAALSPRLASAVAEARGKPRRTAGKRKRAENPTDWRAAQRLRNQREKDDKDIDFLFKLFVPSSAGTVEKVAKKDRLSLSTS